MAKEIYAEDLNDSVIDDALDEVFGRSEDVDDEDEEVETDIDDDEDDEPDSDDDGDDDEDSSDDDDESDTEEDSPTDEPEDKKSVPDEEYTLNYLGQIYKKNRDETIALAQQGMDLPRQKQKVEELNERLKEADEWKHTLEEFAENAGFKGDLPAFMEQVGIANQLKVAKDKGEEISEIEAYKRWSKNRATRKESFAKSLEPEQPKPNEDYSKFLKNHPEVEAADIPREVWDAVNKGEDLEYAYTAWENRKLKSDNEALKQNLKNAKRSTGSMKSSGKKPTGKDTIDDLIDSGWG